MLDILEIAKEEGLKEGLKEGLEKGLKQGRAMERLETTREMLVETLIGRFNIISSAVSEQIRALQNPDVLKALFHHAIRCRNLQEFESVLKQAA